MRHWYEGTTVRSNKHTSMACTPDSEVPGSHGNLEDQDGPLAPSHRPLDGGLSVLFLTSNLLLLLLSLSANLKSELLFLG